MTTSTKEQMEPRFIRCLLISHQIPEEVQFIGIHKKQQTTHLLLKFASFIRNMLAINNITFNSRELLIGISQKQLAIESF